MKRLDLAIESDLGNVPLAAVAVNRVCLELGLDATSAGQVELCIAEAATNSIRHAYHESPGHTVQVTLSASQSELHIEVADTGTPMPAEHQQTLLHGPKSPDSQLDDRQSLPEGGRGLGIIYALMDSVSYVSRAGHNRLVMVKHLALQAVDTRQTIS